MIYDLKKKIFLKWPLKLLWVSMVYQRSCFSNFFYYFRSIPNTFLSKYCLQHCAICLGAKKSPPCVIDETKTIMDTTYTDQTNEMGGSFCLQFFCHPIRDACLGVKTKPNQPTNVN